MLAKFCLGHLLPNRDMDDRKGVVPAALNYMDIDDISFGKWLLDGSGLALAC
jgi:hypothetical protein